MCVFRYAGIKYTVALKHLWKYLLIPYRRASSLFFQGIFLYFNFSPHTFEHRTSQHAMDEDMILC
jgi:hypothetical protein